MQHSLPRRTEFFASPKAKKRRLGGSRRSRLHARVRGRYGGRLKKLSPKELKTIRTLLRSNEVAVQDIAAQFGVNRSTVYRNVAASTTEVPRGITSSN